jgi:hypothetical protein
MTEQVRATRTAPDGWVLSRLDTSGRHWPGRIPREAEGEFISGVWTVELTLATSPDGSHDVVSLTVRTLGPLVEALAASPTWQESGQRIRKSAQRLVATVAAQEGLTVDQWLERHSPTEVAKGVPARITGRGLRALPVDALATHLLAQARMIAATGARSADAQAIAAMEKTVRKARRRRLTPEHLRRVADVYAAALKRGGPPTEAVRNEFGVSRATAERYVSAARSSGHLTARSPHDPTQQKERQ